MPPRNNRWVDPEGKLHITSSGIESWTSPGEVRFTDKAHLEYDYVVTVSIADDPTPMAVVSSVQINQRPGGRPVSGKGVRDELGAVRVAAIQSRTVAIWDADAKGVEPWPAFGAAQRASKGANGSEGRAAVLKDTAETYRWAQAEGLGVQEEVARKLRCKPGTAGKWIWEARQAGYLPPANGTTRPRLDR